MCTVFSSEDSLKRGIESDPMKNRRKYFQRYSKRVERFINFRIFSAIFYCWQLIYELVSVHTSIDHTHTHRQSSKRIETGVKLPPFRNFAAKILPTCFASLCLTHGISVSDALAQFSRLCINLLGMKIKWEFNQSV